MNDEELALHRLECGRKYPYDAPDRWREGNESPPLPANDKAHATARGVLSDLCDRRGIKQELDMIDEEVRQELVTSMATIIRVGMRE